LVITGKFRYGNLISNFITGYCYLFILNITMLDEEIEFYVNMASDPGGLFICHFDALYNYYGS